MSDSPVTLVERLRAACVGHPHAKIAWPHRILHEAAAEIESLRSRNAELEGALKPFADRADYFEGRIKANGDAWRDDDMYCDDPPTDIYLAQLRAAKTTLSRTPSQSLDRMRKERAVIEAARLVCNARDSYSLNKLVDSLTNLDKPDTPNGE